MDDTWLSPSARKSPLILARPDRMEEVLDRGDGKLLGWRFKDGYGEYQTLIPEQVIHHKLFNPHHDIRGLAPWYAAKVAAEADYASGVFARNLSENNGDRGPFVFSDGAPSKEQIEQISQVLREKRTLNRRGDFRPTFIAAPGVKVENPDVQAVDSAFVAQRLESRHEVFIAFGVPPSMASVTATYSIGSASDRFILIEETCMPLADRIAEGVEMVSKKFTQQASTLYAKFDFSEHSTMQQARSERFTLAISGVKEGMPWKTANDYLQLGLPKFPGWELARVSHRMPVLNQSSPPEQPVETDPVEDQDEEKSDSFAELKELFKCQHHHAPGESCKKDAAEMQDGDTVTPRDPARIKMWEDLVRRRAVWVKRFESRFNRHLMLARAETLSKLEANFEARSAEGDITKAGALDLIFDIGRFIANFTSGLAEVSTQAIETAGQELWEDELGRDPDDDPLTMASAEVLTVVQGRQNHLSGAGVDIWNEVRDEIGNAIEDGSTLDEITDRVRTSFNGISSTRARTIAVTEVTAAYEGGRQLTLREAGVEYKEWLTSGDGRVRASHEAADGQTVKIDEEFRIGDARLLYPGVAGGPAAEVINCRCMMLAGEEPEEESADG